MVLIVVINCVINSSHNYSMKEYRQENGQTVTLNQPGWLLGQPPRTISLFAVCCWDLGLSPPHHHHHHHSCITDSPLQAF